MTILPDVTCVSAVAGDPVLLHGAFAAVLAGVRSRARIYELTVVQSHFTYHSLGVHHVSGLDPFVVHSYLSHAAN